MLVCMELGGAGLGRGRERLDWVEVGRLDCIEVGGGRGGSVGFKENF